MEYDYNKKEINLAGKKLNNLDKLTLKFIKVLEKYVEYVIISGYVSILLGRSRATEDVDLYIKKISFDRFLELYNELKKQGFWCLNADTPLVIYSYLKDNLAVRFSIDGESIPNFEVKFPKKKIDEETFEDFITVTLNEGKIKISSLERQIAFKRYYLKSNKDLEDALHIEEIFGDKLDYQKINKYKEIIKNIQT